jgi:nicotinamidase-related amidase
VAVIEYNSHRTGLVLVDPYNDFLSEEGKVWPRVREVAEAVGLHQHLRELLAAVRAAGIQVFVAPHRRWRPGNLDRWRRPAPPQRAIHGGRVFEDGAFGGQWHPEFGPQEGDVISYEHWGENGFAATDLDLQLRQHGVEDIILAGMTAPGCVEGTGRFAIELGYSVTLVTDATAAYSKELMYAAHHLTGPFYADAIVTTDELIAALPTG